MLGTNIVPSNQATNNPNNYNRIIAVITAILVFLVALGSFALSYNNLMAMAQENGITGNLAYVWPLLIDFSLIVFSLSVVNAYLQSETTWKQWLLVGLYTLATIGFNVLHAPNNLQAQVVAAIAPISLFFSFELLMSQLKNAVKKQGLTLNINQLAQQLTAKKKELNTIVNTKEKELDTLTAKIEQSKLSLEQLKDDIKQAKTVKFNSIEQARQLSLEQSTNDRQVRLTQLLDTLSVNPNPVIAQLADDFQVSRNTIYNDINTLIEQGVISKNGEGYKVTQ